MPESARRTDELPEVNHPVRWLGSAWDRIARAADVLTAKEHRKITPTEIIRIATLEFVERVLDEPSAKAS